MDDEYIPTIEDFKILVEGLNKASDALGTRIHEKEKFLKELGIGVQIWITIGTKDYKLGYQKYEGNWRILIDYTEHGKDDKVRIVRPLENVPRALRLSAARHIDELFPALYKAGLALEQRLNEYLLEGENAKPSNS